MRITKEGALKLVSDFLQHFNTSKKNAKYVADALVSAEIDGQKGHGFSRLPFYVEQLACGKIDGKVDAKVVSCKAGVVKIDANYGFAFPALSLAIEKLTEITPTQGIATAIVSHSHHFGQAGYHVERLAQHGLIGLMFGNTPKAIAPWGGNKPLFGTNPIAFSVPRNSEAPLVIDLSLSKVARGKVMLAKQQNQPIPADWALDEKGIPTTDAQAALSGSMLPISEAKGSALALMVEILAATLTGSNFGFEASSFLDDKGNSPNTGQILMALDSSFFADNFSERLEFLLSTMLQQESVRLPGSQRLANRKIANVEGINISDKLYQQITTMVNEYA